MSAIRAIHPYRHEWALGLGGDRHSVVSGQMSAETSRSTPSRKAVASCASPTVPSGPGLADP